MAIVIEEGKRGVSILSLATWGVVLVIIVVTVYYLFFKKPQQGDITPPPGFQTTQAVASLQKDTDVVKGLLDEQRRQQQVPPVTVGIRGRENPFVPIFPVALPDIATGSATSTTSTEPGFEDFSDNTAPFFTFP